MKLWTRLSVLTGLLLVQATILVPGYAAEAHMHRCVDANGRVYYSGRPDTECLQGERDQMTRDGLVLDRPMDQAAIDTDDNDKERRQRLARQRYDRMLLATYTSEDQIEIAKQRRLQTPRQALEWSEEKLSIYRTRLVELTISEAGYTKSNKPVPESLKEEIEDASTALERLNEELESRQNTIDRIISKYDAEKARFLELSEFIRNR